MTDKLTHNEVIGLTKLLANEHGELPIKAIAANTLGSMVRKGVARVVWSGTKAVVQITAEGIGAHASWSTRV